jgi:hypothetical protein
MYDDEMQAADPKNADPTFTVFKLVWAENFRPCKRWLVVLQMPGGALRESNSRGSS